MAVNTFRDDNFYLSDIHKCDVSHTVEEDTKASEDEVCEFLAMINNDNVDLRDLV